MMTWHCASCNTERSDKAKACCDRCKTCCKCEAVCQQCLATVPVICEVCGMCGLCCMCSQCPKCLKMARVVPSCCHFCNDDCKCAEKYAKLLKTSPTFDLTSAVSSYYALLEAELRSDLLLNDRSPKAKHDPAMVKDYLARVKKEISEFEPKLARVFYDYIVLACTGEAAYTHGHAAQPRMIGAGLTDLHQSEYMWAKKHDPQLILKTVNAIFNDYEWSGGYGGKKWGAIAKAGLMYGKEPNKLFIDHAVDLSHHGGLYLNKPTKQFNVNKLIYIALLNRKANGGMFDDVKPTAFVMGGAHELIAAGQEEGVISKGANWINVGPRPMYEPIKWKMESFQVWSPDSCETIPVEKYLEAHSKLKEKISGKAQAQKSE